MFKGVATKITLLAIDTVTNSPKTGDAANLTAYVKKDGGTVTVLADTSATEDSATNAPGLYTFDVSAAETTADWLEFSGKSSTTNVRLIPKTVFTREVSSGSGARTVTITVNDGATVIVGAIVRLTLGVDTYTATTIAGGIATFNVNDGTWTVAITKAGYTYAGTTIVVDGTETATYSMSAVTITPAAAGQTNAYLTTRTGGGTVLGSVVVTFKMVAGPGTAANSYNSKEFTATSHASTGLLEVTLLQSATYYGIRGDGTEIQFTTGTDGTYALPEILGEDAN